MWFMLRRRTLFTSPPLARASRSLRQPREREGGREQRAHEKEDLGVRPRALGTNSTLPLTSRTTQGMTNTLAAPLRACRTETAAAAELRLPLPFTGRSLGPCRRPRHPSGTERETEAQKQSHCTATQLNTATETQPCRKVYLWLFVFGFCKRPRRALAMRQRLSQRQEAPRK